MRRVVNFALGLLVVLFFALSATAIIAGALREPGYAPHGFGGDLFDLTIGGVVAFLVTTLGLAVANDQTGATDSMKVAISGDTNKGGGEWLIGIVGAVYLLVGIAFIVLSVFPGLIAVPEDSEQLTDAPQYLTTQAKAFVGVALAGLAAIGTALKVTP